MSKNNKYFDGYYFKHHKGNNTISFIPGKSYDTTFIQVITNDKSYNFKFPHIEMDNTQANSPQISVGSCTFSTNGIIINLDGIQGKIRYSNPTPIKYDIMGPFKYFPMQCRHGVISMHHKLDGYLNIGDQVLDFRGGTGYIEKDSGNSFPSKYLWVQCNDFPNKSSIMVSIADIPFLGTNFMGCICVVWINNIEYRFATYLGVKIVCYSDEKIILKQGKYLLIINITQNNSHHPLYAPQNGKMTNIIRESNSSTANFKMFIHNKLVFDNSSNNVSFEYVM